MASGILRKAMVYLGLTDDEFEDYDYEDPGPQSRDPAATPNPQMPRPSRFLLRPCGPMAREMPEPSNGVTVTPRAAVVRPITPMHGAKVHLVAPGRFADAQEIGDRFKNGQPVIVNLQANDREPAVPAHDRLLQWGHLRPVRRAWTRSPTRSSFSLPRMSRSQPRRSGGFRSAATAPDDGLCSLPSTGATLSTTSVSCMSSSCWSAPCSAGSPTATTPRSTRSARWCFAVDRAGPGPAPPNHPAGRDARHLVPGRLHRGPAVRQRRPADASPI